jgi:hypothetical protein
MIHYKFVKYLGGLFNWASLNSHTLDKIIKIARIIKFKDKKKL